LLFTDRMQLACWPEKEILHAWLLGAGWGQPARTQLHRATKRGLLVARAVGSVTTACCKASTNSCVALRACVKVRRSGKIGDIHAAMKLNMNSETEQNYLRHTSTRGNDWPSDMILCRCIQWDGERCYGG
jgi:hypothetical protein